MTRKKPRGFHFGFCATDGCNRAARAVQGRCTKCMGKFLAGECLSCLYYTKTPTRWGLGITCPSCKKHLPGMISDYVLDEDVKMIEHPTRHGASTGAPYNYFARLTQNKMDEAIIDEITGLTEKRK